MRRLHVLLNHTLDGNIAHTRSAHRLADRFGVGAVILVALDVGFNVLRGNQFDVVTAAFQLTASVVRSPTRFHANLGSDRYALAQRRQPTVTFILAAPLRLVVAIDAVNMECVFCDINANPCNLHLDLSFGLLTFEPQPYRDFAAKGEEESIPLLSKYPPAKPCLLFTFYEAAG